MWGDNSANYGFGYNTVCMCHTATMPCACTYPMINTNVQMNSNNLYYQSTAHENTIYDQEATYQMATNIEVDDSWLLSNPDHNQQNNIDGSSLINLPSYGSCSGNQYQGQFIQMQTHGIQTSLQLPMVGGIAPEARFGAMELPTEYWAPNQFSFSPYYNPGNILQTDAVGTYSNSTSITSLGTQQLIPQDHDHSQNQPENNPPVTRQDRILRYFAKKKARKYVKKMINSSRKTYAQTRPRIRGRFARRSQLITDASDKQLIEVNDKKAST